MTYIIAIWQNLPQLFVGLMILLFLQVTAREIYEDRKQKTIAKIKEELSSQPNLLEDIRKAEKELQQLKWDIESKEESIRKLKMLLATKYGTNPDYETVTLAIPKDTESISFSSYSGKYTSTRFKVEDIKEELGSEDLTDHEETEFDRMNSESEQEDIPYY